MPELFKDVMPSLMIHKKDVFIDDEEKDEFFNKNSYIINRVLSMYIDCVMPANEMNMRYYVDGKLKHDFFINTIKGYKRSFNYAKSIKHSDLDIIKEYYGVGNRIAKEYHSLLTPEQLETIRTKLDKGGTISNNQEKEEWSEK